MAIAETDEAFVKSLEVGDVPKALQLARAFFEKHSSQRKVARNWLTRLQNFCLKSMSEVCSTSIALNVYQLADLLCQIIGNSWHGDRILFMRGLYHIVVFMMKYDASSSRQLSVYFFSLKEAKRKPLWTENELIVLTNLSHNFSIALHERLPTILGTPEGENSLPNWVDFLFELSELQGFVKLYKTLVNINQILINVYSASPEKLTGVMDLLLAKLDSWSSRIIASNALVPDCDKCFDSLNMTFENLMKLLEPNEELVSRVGRITSCLEKIKIWLPQYAVSLEMLECVLKLCESLKIHQDLVETNADRLFACARSRELSLKVFPTVIALVVVFRADIMSSVLVSSRLAELAKLMVLLGHSSSGDKSKMLKRLDVIYCGLSILTSSSISKEGLQSVFQDVRALIKQLETIIVEAGRKSQMAFFSVIGALFAYKKVELYDETERICRYLFSLFIKTDPQMLFEDRYLRDYVDRWLRCWTFLSEKKVMGVEAQVLLIIFASVHPKFIIPTMKAWASLKKSKPPSIKIDATVLDVIAVNIGEIKQQFPGVKMDFNKEVLLLGEIHAYTKMRDLHGGPVLGVFKTAAKVVKDYIALANILCCTIDAFSFGGTDKHHYSSLRASLSNIVSHLEKWEKTDEKELKCPRSVLLCTLGNLFYHKARLEAQKLRQKAEELEKEREALSSKDKLPLFRSGEKDELDVTEVTLVSSNDALKWSCCDELISTLEKALKYWSAGEPSLEPDFLLCGTLSFAKGAGYLLRLYGYRGLEISCWQTLYKIAKKLKSDKYMILAAGELLGVCSSVDSSVVSEVEDILKESKRIDARCYAHHLYRVSLVKNLFLRGEFEESRAALKQIDEVAISPHFLVKAQHQILSALLEMDQPKGGTTTVAPLVSIVKIFRNILFLVQNDKWETFNEASVIQWLLIEAATLLSTFYADMKNIRKARCYMQSEMKLIRKLGLPAKVCEAMALRCWVDLLTCNIADSDLNAEEIESLLQLGVVKKESVNGSPLAGGASIKCVPHFLKLKDCQCHFCSVANYPSLVLNSIIIRILILQGSDAHREAQLVISIGFSVVEVVKRKDLDFTSLVHPFSASVARFYYVVASAYLQWGRYKEANRFASLASNAVHSHPIRNRKLIGSIKRLLLTIQWVPSYQPLAKQELDISNIYNEEVPPERAVTPEAQKYGTTKPWISTVHKNKKFDLDCIGDQQFFRKRLSAMKEFEAAVASLGDIDSSPPSHSDPKDKEPYENVKISKMPRKFFCTPKATADSKLEDMTKSMKKLNLKRFDVDNIDSELGTAPLPSTPGVLVTPATPPTRKMKTETKPKILRANTRATPSIASLAKLGQSTPTIKVFFDPEGVASTTKRAKTAKKAPRLGKVMQECGFGTPATTSSRARTARGKLTMDDNSDDDLVMVAAPKKKPLRKGRGEKGMTDNDEVDGETAVVDKQVDSVGTLLASQLKVRDEPHLEMECEGAGSMAAPIKRPVRTRVPFSLEHRTRGQQSVKTAETPTENAHREQPEDTPQLAGSSDSASSVYNSIGSDESILVQSHRKLLNRRVMLDKKPIIVDETITETSSIESEGKGKVDMDSSLSKEAEAPNGKSPPKRKLNAKFSQLKVRDDPETESNLENDSEGAGSMAAPIKRAVRSRVPVLPKQCTAGQESVNTAETPTKPERRPHSAGTNVGESSVYFEESILVQSHRKLLNRPVKSTRKPIIVDDTVTETSSIASEGDGKFDTDTSLAKEVDVSNGIVTKSDVHGAETMAAPTKVLRKREERVESTAVPEKRNMRLRLPITEIEEIVKNGEEAPTKKNSEGKLGRRSPSADSDDSHPTESGSSSVMNQSDFSSSYVTADDPEMSLVRVPRRKVLDRRPKTRSAKPTAQDDSLCETTIKERTTQSVNQPPGRIQNESTGIQDEEMPYVTKRIPQRLNSRNLNMKKDKCEESARAFPKIKSQVPLAGPEKPEKNARITSSNAAAPSDASGLISAPHSKILNSKTTKSVHDDSSGGSDQDSFDIVDTTIIPELNTQKRLKKDLKLI